MSDNADYDSYDLIDELNQQLAEANKRIAELEKALSLAKDVINDIGFSPDNYISPDLMRSMFEALEQQNNEQIKSW